FPPDLVDPAGDGHALRHAHHRDLRRLATGGHSRAAQAGRARGPRRGATVAGRLTRTESLDVRRAYARDASGLELVPDAVARPSAIDDGVAVMREAAASRTPVTPAGAQTSTTGASITDRGILLSLNAMNRILDVDPARRTIRVQVGATVAQVDAA